jgi:hypothetical protein
VQGLYHHKTTLFLILKTVKRLPTIEKEKQILKTVKRLPTIEKEKQMNTAVYVEFKKTQS